MQESRYDRLLVALVLLAPLLMLALTQWRASLDNRWYSPMDGRDLALASGQLEQSAREWLRLQPASGAQLYLLADRNCPCTQVTLRKLQDSIKQSPRTDLSLNLRYLDAATPQDAAWQALLHSLPATPTLIAADGGRLAYAGPALSGGFCSSTLQRVLGITALQSSPDLPLINLMDRGCYCRLPPPA